MNNKYFDPSKLYKCKCKTCGTRFETSAPSRIEEPICAVCQLKENRKPGPIGLPPDFEKVQKELREEFNVCSRCNNNPLIPLQSFKVNGRMYCQGCYQTIAESKGRPNPEKSKIYTSNGAKEESIVHTLVQQRGLKPTMGVV